MMPFLSLNNTGLLLTDNLKNALDCTNRTAESHMSMHLSATKSQKGGKCFFLLCIFLPNIYLISFLLFP